MAGTSETIEAPCPRCGGRSVEVLEAVKASACLPFPELRRVRCGRCGAEGTRALLRGRATITWGIPIRREDVQSLS